MKKFCSRSVSLGGAFVALLICQWGCSSQMREEMDSPDEPGKGDVKEETSLSLLDGYNKVLQIGRQKCVEAIDPKQPVYNVGNFSEEQTIQFISTKADLTRNFNLKLDNLEASIGTVGVGAKFDLVNNYKKNDTSNYLLITTKKNYRVDMLDNRNLRLTGNGVRLLEDFETSTYLSKCGTHYISGVEYEAAFYLLIRISASSLDKTNKVAAGLSAKGISFEPVTLSADISGGLENLVSDTEISTQLYTAAEGFIVPTDLLKAFQKTFDEDTFNALANIGEKMKLSIENDLCQDTGREGVVCSDGLAAQGYFANVTQRKAKPSGFFFKDYSTLSNAPVFKEEINPYFQMNQKMELINKYLTTYQTLADKIEAVYWEELLPVLETATPFNYSIYTKDDNAISGITLDDVNEQAYNWAKRFNPESTSSLTALKEQLNQCKLGATYGNYQPCSGNPLEEQVYIQAQDELKEYITNSRIWVVNYAVAMISTSSTSKVKYPAQYTPRTLTYEAAKNGCAYLGQDSGQAYRLPNLSEAKHLNLVVRHNNALPRKINEYTYWNWLHLKTDSRDWSNAIWFNDPSQCNKTGALRMLPDGEFEVVCEDKLNSLDLTPLCIPQSGLYLPSLIGF